MPDRFTSPSGAPAPADGPVPCQSGGRFPESGAAHPPAAAPSLNRGLPVPCRCQWPAKDCVGWPGGRGLPGCCRGVRGAQALGMHMGTAVALEPTAPRSDAGEDLGLPLAVPLGRWRGEEPGRGRGDTISGFFCLFFFPASSQSSLLIANCYGESASNAVGADNARRRRHGRSDALQAGCLIKSHGSCG